MTNDAVRIDDEKTTKGNPTILNEYPIVSGNAFGCIGQDGEFYVATKTT
jgi:hypothetical protein